MTALVATGTRRAGRYEPNAATGENSGEAEKP